MTIVTRVKTTIKNIIFGYLYDFVAYRYYYEFVSHFRGMPAVRVMPTYTYKLDYG